METFLVRIWVPSDGNGNGHNDGPHGFLEHPRSERSWKFAGAEELLEQLSNALGAVPENSDKSYEAPAEHLFPQGNEDAHPNERRP